MHNVKQKVQADTKQNIERAQKEIDRLEAEAKEPQPSPSSNRRTHDPSKKAATAKQSVNGIGSAEHAPEKDADTVVAEDMKKASLEDKADT